MRDKLVLSLCRPEPASHTNFCFPFISMDTPETVDFSPQVLQILLVRVSPR